MGVFERCVEGLGFASLPHSHQGVLERCVELQGLASPHGPTFLRGSSSGVWSCRVRLPHYDPHSPQGVFERCVELQGRALTHDLCSPRPQGVFERCVELQAAELGEAAEEEEKDGWHRGIPPSPALRSNLAPALLQLNLYQDAVVGGVNQADSYPVSITLTLTLTS